MGSISNTMNNKLSWRDALKQFNDNRINDGEKYIIPKRGTPEYASVRKMMGDDGDAVEFKPNQTITGQEPPAPVTPNKPREPSKSKTPKRNNHCQQKRNHYGLMSLSLLKRPPKSKKSKVEEC